MGYRWLEITIVMVSERSYEITVRKSRNYKVYPRCVSRIHNEIYSVNEKIYCSNCKRPFALATAVACLHAKTPQGAFWDTPVLFGS